MMDFGSIKEAIKEANNLKIRNIIVDGGEFFIYPFWREFLKELKSYDYVPNLVSTKYPLTENEIKDFSVYNMVHPTFRVIRQSCRAYNLSLK